MKKVGTVTHYYGKIGVAILQLDEPLAVGDAIKFQGHGTDFDQTVRQGEMQMDHTEVPRAAAGTQIGLKTDQPVKEGTEVFVQ
ncbi:MAG TPA: hypothetical protein VJ553_03415 [Candidatus Paceibacterota bacterium]|nr:hypothetical protein [Candidatus Paceibacterota bacterium]